MRSATIISAALAVGALAKPLAQKRDVVVETQVNVVYTTLVVAGSAPAPAPAATSAPATAPNIPGAPHLVAHHPGNAQPAAPADGPAIPGAHHLVGHHQKAQPAPAAAPATAPNIPGAPHLVAHHPGNAQPAAPASGAIVPGAHHLAGHPYQAPKPAPAPQLDDYQAAGVNQHNLHRHNHSAAALVWDNDLAASAAALATTCNFAHDVSLGPASNYGQNIASSYPATGSTADELKTVITNMWYNGEVNNFAALYGQESPNMSNFGGWGHFTAVVWKGSKRVGCHTVNCSNMGYFTVCNYGEAGNIIGEFAHNVLPSKGDATVEIR